MIERSRTPVSASCSVRGIGVALSVSTCTSARNCFSRSLWPTPKCCSSSTIRSPRSLNLIDLPSSAWVPTTMSIVPSARSFLVLRVLRRDQARGLRDIDRKAAEPLGEGLACAGAPSSVVGTTTATCLPFMRRRECRAQRHLGLAEADIAADQPVHRTAGFEVLEDGVDRAELVLGLLIGKARAELVIEAAAPAISALRADAVRPRS